MTPETVYLLLALVVALALLARERRRARRLRRALTGLRGSYLSNVLRLQGRLVEQEADNETLRDRLMLATLREGDSTCALDADEPPAIAGRGRREYPS